MRIKNIYNEKKIFVKTFCPQLAIGGVMKKKVCFLIIPAMVFLLSLSASSQDARNIWDYGNQKQLVVDGDIMVLKNEKTINAGISPQSFKLGLKELPDSVYAATRVKEYNDEKPGSGDAWLVEWQDAKKNFLPAFIAGFNSIVPEKYATMVQDDLHTDYKFVLRPLQMVEFMGGVFFIFDMDVVRTKDPGGKIATVLFPRLKNEEYSRKINGRFVGAYYTAGVFLGKYFNKNIYK
jgi:hypothetical protein